MEVIFKNLKAARKKNTYQAEWPEFISCPKCKDKAFLMMIVDDEKGEVANLRPMGAKVWPHDYMAIAHYFCSNCGEIEAHWNQG